MSVLGNFRLSHEMRFFPRIVTTTMASSVINFRVPRCTPSVCKLAIVSLWCRAIHTCIFMCFISNWTGMCELKFSPYLSTFVSNPSIYFLNENKKKGHNNGWCLMPKADHEPIKSGTNLPGRQKQAYFQASRRHLAHSRQSALFDLLCQKLYWPAWEQGQRPPSVICESVVHMGDSVEANIGTELQ